MSCCTTLEPNPHRDSHIEGDRTQKSFCNNFPEISSDNFDAVDNPKTWKNVSLENKTLFQTMECEKNRRDSFDKKWPLQFINIDELVETGFFYLQYDDKVQCAYCKLILCNWKSGDRPMKEHIKSSPKCSYLVKTENMSATVNRFPVKSVLPSNKPKNTRMIELKTRMSTFRNWPHTTIKVQDLADCGLYYTGIKDIVTCFYCGGSLSNWEPSDEPIVEHARFYPHCNYLRIIQTRPVYKRILSVDMAGGINLLTNNIQAKDILESDIVKKAKEIFPSSLVEKVTVQHLQKGEKFSSLHHLCEKILQQQSRDTRINPKVENSKASSHEPSSISTKTRVESEFHLCKICMDREREVVFQPCGHLISCEKCATRISNCPLCRKPINGRMRTFLS